MTVIAIPSVLREKLGENAAEALIELINKAEEHSIDATIKAVEDKFEKRLAEEMGKLKVEMYSLRADIIRWMFIFWIGQAATIIGILFAFFRK